MRAAEVGSALLAAPSSAANPDVESIVLRTDEMFSRTDSVGAWSTLADALGSTIGVD